MSYQEETAPSDIMNGWVKHIPEEMGAITQSIRLRHGPPKHVATVQSMHKVGKPPSIHVGRVSLCLGLFLIVMWGIVCCWQIMQSYWIPSLAGLPWYQPTCTIDHILSSQGDVLFSNPLLNDQWISDEVMQIVDMCRK